MIKIEEINNYKDFGKVLLISNGIIESVITLDVGPRIVKFGFTDGQNILQANRNSYGSLIADDEEYQKYFGEGKFWELLGGHRIWTSPESYPETLYPDLDAVEYQTIDNGAIFTPDAETENGLQKQMIVTMSNDGANMNVGMRIINISDEEKTYAVWGITVCENGGKLIIPMNTNDTGRTPNRTAAFWPYTNMGDDRFIFGKKYVSILPNSQSDAMKIGFNLNNSKTYYKLGEDVFIKSYPVNTNSTSYPDNGCTFETYSNSLYIEVESLGELKTVKPTEALELTETWSLKKSDFVFDSYDDSSIDEFVKSLKD